MKTMVKLAVLFLTLLLLTGVAFANGDCHNYEFTVANFDNPASSSTFCVELCFDYGAKSGTYSGFCEQPGNLVLFFDSMNEQALWYSTSTSPYPNMGYLKFHGDRLFIFTAIEFCSGKKLELRGHKVDECKKPK